jgi:hypothetical protein
MMPRRMSDTTILETCQLVLDRPRQGDPHALMYVAEATTSGKPQQIATSSVFHPEVDPTAHRTALAQLESHLVAQGWHREPKPRQALIGVRYQRWREAAGPG